MPAGFEVIGSHGVVQIDENFINLGLTAKGTITIPAGTAGGPMGGAGLTVTATSPILCIRPLSTSVALYDVTRSGDQYTYTLIGGFVDGGGTPQAETFAWYLFDQMSPGDAGDVGLEVHDASGNATFNSNFSPMIVRAIAPVPNALLIGNPASVDIGSGTYAVCLTEGRSQTVDNFPVTDLYWETVKVTSTGAVTSYAKYGAFPSGVSVNVTQGGQILLADVSGL